MVYMIKSHHEGSQIFLNHDFYFYQEHAAYGYSKSQVYKYLSSEHWCNLMLNKSHLFFVLNTRKLLTKLAQMHSNMVSAHNTKGNSFGRFY